jgi:DNA-binding NarL/FixJ family response regulator
MRNGNITCGPDAKTIRVLLVDDHSIVRAGLRALLETAPDIEVIGEAENGQEAVTKTRMLRPDVVLLDFAMPLLNGLEATRQIARDVPASRVLMLSSYRDEEHVCQAVEAGAAGYMVKESGLEELVETVRRTSKGEAAFSPPVLKNLLKAWRATPSDDPGAPCRKSSLSGRQAEILQLIAEGYGTKQIAGVLFISVKTVEKHRQIIMNKLNLHKIAALTRYAVSSGMVESNRQQEWPAKLPGTRTSKEKKMLMM